MFDFFSHRTHYLKNPAISMVGYISNLLPQESFYLSTHPSKLESLSHDILAQELDAADKSKVYRVYWELAKMHNPQIDEPDWGEKNFFNNLKLATHALHRVKALKADHLYEVRYNTRLYGGEEAGTSIYYSLSERLGQDPANGYIGYVNGMCTTLEQAARDVLKLTERLKISFNIHCVYLPTRKNSYNSSTKAFVLDGLRHMAADGGAYTRASCLIAQQWIDRLDDNDKYFLQLCSSEGASHVNAALRLLRLARPDLLSRLRIISIAPACQIIPQANDHFEVLNFIKKEDRLVIPWGTHVHLIHQPHPCIRIVNHTTNDDPHDPTSQDFAEEIKPFVEEFLASGNLICNLENCWYLKQFS